MKTLKNKLFIVLTMFLLLIVGSILINNNINNDTATVTKTGDVFTNQKLSIQINDGK